MNMRTFDLNLLRALHALLEHRNVSMAARQLNLTQPAVSAALSRLRRALDDALLVREGNTMVLSHRAERMLPKLRLLMSEIEQTLQEQVFEPATTTRTFRLAATDDAIEIILAPTIAGLHDSAPGVSLDIVGVSETVDHDLLEGRVDLVVTAEWWLRHVSSREHLFSDEYMGLSAHKSKYSLAKYMEAEHVLVAPHGRKPGVVDQALRKVKGSRRVTVTVPDFGSAARLVASSGLIATMPSKIAAHYAHYYSLHVFKPQLDLPDLTVAMAVSRRALSDPAVAWLMQQIRESAAALTR